MTTRKIIASVVHTAILTTDERAALVAPPVALQPGFCKMTVAYPADHGESWCAWGQGQRSLFQQDTDGGVIYVVVPKSEAATLSRAGYVLSS